MDVIGGAVYGILAGAIGMTISLATGSDLPMPVYALLPTAAGVVGGFIGYLRHYNIV